MKTAVRPRRSQWFLPEVTNTSIISRRRTGAPLRSVSDESTRSASREEVARFRHSVKQNVCVQMLQEGNHRSFTELFALLRSDQTRRAAADPGSALRLRPPLEEREDKLDVLKLHLSRAEQAERTGFWSVACEQRLFLARFFSTPEDLSLSLHFYQSCVHREGGGRSPAAVEARGGMAELYLQQGDLEEARREAELCLTQAEDWTDSSGRPLRLRARRTLWRIYVRLADAPLDAGNYAEALELLHKGQGVATESEDKHTEGEAAYRLGLTYQSTGDHHTAKKFFNTCLQICGTLQDPQGLGQSYKAMAKSLESEGNTEEAVQCLEKLIDICRSSGLQKDTVDACLCLGNIYYTMGQCRRASDFFLQGYEVACNLGDVSLLQKAQVKVACARARSMNRKYSSLAPL